MKKKVENKIKERKIFHLFFTLNIVFLISSKFQEFDKTFDFQFKIFQKVSKFMKVIIIILNL